MKHSRLHYVVPGVYLALVSTAIVIGLLTVGTKPLGFVGVFLLAEPWGSLSHTLFGMDPGSSVGMLLAWAFLLLGIVINTCLLVFVSKSIFLPGAWAPLSRSGVKAFQWDKHEVRSFLIVLASGYVLFLVCPSALIHDTVLFSVALFFTYKTRLGCAFVATVLIAPEVLHGASSILTFQPFVASCVGAIFGAKLRQRRGGWSPRPDLGNRS